MGGLLRAALLVLCWSWGAVTNTCGLAQAQAPPPNFVIIFLDDAGWGDMGANNPETVETPFMDSLAKKSLRWGLGEETGCISQESPTTSVMTCM
jgi:hypothetical protein